MAYQEFIRETQESLIGRLNKGLGVLSRALEPEQVRQLDWNLLREDLSLPAAVLYQDRLAHNLKWMQDFINAYGVRLAPHGKTTMAPRLFEMQLEGGAWGITLATAHQVLVAYAHGVRRVLMANELIGRENMAIIARVSSRIPASSSTVLSTQPRKSTTWVRSSPCRAAAFTCFSNWESWRDAPESATRGS